MLCALKGIRITVMTLMADGALTLVNTFLVNEGHTVMYATQNFARFMVFQKPTAYLLAFSNVAYFILSRFQNAL